MTPHDTHYTGYRAAGVLCQRVVLLLKMHPEMERPRSGATKPVLTSLDSGESRYSSIRSMLIKVQGVSGGADGDKTFVLMGPENHFEIALAEKHLLADFAIADA